MASLSLLKGDLSRNSKVPRVIVIDLEPVQRLQRTPLKPSRRFGSPPKNSKTLPRAVQWEVVELNSKVVGMAESDSIQNL